MKTVLLGCKNYQCLHTHTPLFPCNGQDIETEYDCIVGMIRNSISAKYESHWNGGNNPSTTVRK